MSTERNDRHGQICPCAEFPFEECFCARMDSRHIAETVYYCGGHYEECDIYRDRQERLH